jgi:hypothetical protein
VALTEAAFELEREAISRAKVAARLDHSRRVGVPAALALGLANDPSAAEGIIRNLLRRYPDDTSLKVAWAPLVRAAIALRRGDAHEALITAELNPYFDRLAWPPYIRALARLKLGHAAQSVAEFRKILTRKSSLTAGAFIGVPFAYPAAKLGLARALRAEGDAEASRKTYEEFLSGWSGADPEVPVLVHAKRELMQFQPASGRLAYRR